MENKIKKKAEISVFERKKTEILEEAFTNQDLLKFKKKLDLKESKKFEKECSKYNEEYEKVKQSIGNKKSYVKRKANASQYSYSIFDYSPKKQK